MLKLFHCYCFSQGKKKRQEVLSFSIKEGEGKAACLCVNG